MLLGIGAFLALRRAGAVTIDSRGVISVNPLFVAFPLLAMTGVLLLARGATGHLPRLRGWTRQAPTAVFLAAGPTSPPSAASSAAS